MNKKKMLIIASFSAAVAASIGVAVFKFNAETPLHSQAVSPQAISELLASQMNDYQGLPQPFSQWQGKILVISIWGTWCAPCLEEQVRFSQLNKKYAANGVQFIGISSDPKEAIAAFANRHQISFPLLMTAGRHDVELSRDLGNTQQGIPYTLVLGRNREPLLAHTGRLPDEQLERLLEKNIGR